MLLTTTNALEGKHITRYYGIVSGETIIGANIFRERMNKCCAKPRKPPCARWRNKPDNWVPMP